jgi:DNA modification methylase
MKVKAEIINGDAITEMRRLIERGVKVDACVTDPPYGVGLGVKARNQKTLEVVPYDDYDDTPDNLTRLIESGFPLMQSIAKRIVLTPGVRNMWMWPKPSHVGSFFYPSASGCNAWGFSCWQPIFYYGRDPYSGTGSRPDSKMSTEAAEQNGHPCPKPIGQMVWLIERTTLPGETVIDPFMGSGTTGVACALTGRDFIGIEQSADYCAIGEARIKRAQGEPCDVPRLNRRQIETPLFDGTQVTRDSRDNDRTPEEFCAASP